MNLLYRPRRLRRTDTIRKLVRETRITLDNLIYPLFVVTGSNIKEEIPSMPGIYHLSQDFLLQEIDDLVKLGIRAIILFGLPETKDEVGSSAWEEDGIVQRICREIKKRFPELLLITDVCLCQYTSHGHCGIIKDGYVHNDLSLKYLSKVALSHARAGADLVAPSDMMDGHIRAIRRSLDQEGLQEVAIMAYSAKYASSFYGPFRDAAHSAPREGDRSSYQMDPANSNEALREMELDIKEGADILMVKPALSYLDVISKVKENYKLPLAAYNVSGEYAMVKAAAEKGWLDEKETALEILTSIRRAGADIIITYWAKGFAHWIKKEGYDV